VTGPLSERPIMGNKCEEKVEVHIDEEYIEESSSEGTNDLFEIIIFN
jgi:hypothetical protein